MMCETVCPQTSIEVLTATFDVASPQKSSKAQTMEIYAVGHLNSR